MMDKDELRQRMLMVRQNLGAGQRKSLSALAVRHLTRSDRYRRARTVFCYIPVRNEVLTEELCRAVLNDSGKILCVPRCGAAVGVMDAVPVPSLDCLKPGRWGIPAPADDLAATDTAVVDLAVVPGVCFDRQGHRIGYGGGYYDRFLASAAGTVISVGLAFSCQLVERVPVTEHDVAVDCVCTESGIITGSGPGKECVL